MEWAFRPDVPIYTQLAEHLTRRIVSGGYAAGERLPSVRDLALDAGVNPNTVQRALAELERTGLVYSQRTAGRFVTEDAAAIAAERKRLARSRAEEFLGAMAQLGVGAAESVALLEKIKEENE